MSLVVWAGLWAFSSFSFGQVRDGDRLRDALRDFRIGDHWIYDDWAEARRRARIEKKPIFVVFRCVP